MDRLPSRRDALRAGGLAAGRGWRTSEVATGLRTREMELAGPVVWRVYATRDGLPGIETYLLAPGRGWRPETVIRTAGPVQRIELIGGFRDPVRILATGASSARDVCVADGDIYVAGRHRGWAHPGWIRPVSYATMTS